MNQNKFDSMESSFIAWFLWLALSISLLVVFSEVQRRRLSKQPPGPWPLPFIGNLLHLGHNPHQSLARLAKIHGPVMTLRLGLERTVVVSSPKAAREVLQKKDAVFSHRTVPDVVSAWDNENRSITWLPPAQQWRNLRRIFNIHLFTPQRLDAQEPLRRQKLQELARYVADRSSKGLPVDIGRVTFATALNLISGATFSADVVDLRLESSQEFKDVVVQIMTGMGTPNVSDFIPFLARFDLQGLRRRMAGPLKKMHKMFDAQIDQRLRSMEKEASPARNDFLHTLLQLQSQEDGSNYMDREQIKALLLDLFIAGTETTSNTVEWVMAEMLRNPRVMAKAREEVAKVIGATKEVEWSDICDLPYLQAVVKETLRLHPPGPLLLPHKAGANAELQGYKVPEGARLLVNVWAIGRDGELWRDPDEFLPERFLEKDVNFRGQNFEFIPFGAGRRICPGLPLAVRMVHMTLATLLQMFEWKLPEGMTPADVDMSEKFGTAIRMASPLIAYASPITSAFACNHHI